MRYEIKPVAGFTPQIGHLVAMMSHARAATLKEVQHLTQAQLDYFPDEKSNSIGTLLKHMAALESWYQAITFENRDLNEEERKAWRGALPGELILRLIHGNDISHYIDCLQQVRLKTIAEFSRRNDDWLYEVSPSGSSTYYKWFHVMEDEISHRGQIVWLKKRLTF
jgi:uncharacterized damage-inducible protein DinB